MEIILGIRKFDDKINKLYKCISVLGSFSSFVIVDIILYLSVLLILTSWLWTTYYHGTPSQGVNWRLRQKARTLSSGTSEKSLYVCMYVSNDLADLLNVFEN